MQKQCLPVPCPDVAGACPRCHSPLPCSPARADVQSSCSCCFWPHPALCLQLQDPPGLEWAGWELTLIPPSLYPQGPATSSASASCRGVQSPWGSGASGVIRAAQQQGVRRGMEGDCPTHLAQPQQQGAWLNPVMCISPPSGHSLVPPLLVAGPLTIDLRLVGLRVCVFSSLQSEINYQKLLDQPVNHERPVGDHCPRTRVTSVCSLSDNMQYHSLNSKLNRPAQVLVAG